MKRLEFLYCRQAMALCLLALAFQLCSCEDDSEEAPRGVGGVAVSPPAADPEIKGVFVLNEGQMDKNKCSLDYFDYTRGKFYNGLFRAMNPDVPLGLGDTGNDLAVWRGRLYAVVSGSGLIEVADARTVRHIGYVELPGCRHIAFSGGKAYATAYSGETDEETKLQKGTLAEIDLGSLEITRTCPVGFQPEGVAAAGGKLYVANSCAIGPDYTITYERTVSVVDMETMTLEKNIDVAINLNTMQLGADGKIYVISRGDYGSVPSDVYVLDTQTGAVEGALGVRAASMCLAGDSLYIVGNEYSYATDSYERSFVIYDVRKKAVTDGSFIAGGADTGINSPYGIAVNPENGDVFVADAGDYVNPGELFCFSRLGALQWTAVTGDIPGHMAFAEEGVSGLE